MSPAAAALLSFASFFDGFDAGQKFVLVLVAISCVTAVLITGMIAFAAAWANIRENESKNELTRDLLDQGKTAEEIERILKPADGFSRAIGNWGKKK